VSTTNTHNSSSESQARAQYLSFFIAEEEYGVGILRVKEIVEWMAVTRVPGMPASVLGVINLRGKVVPVVDLAVRFGLPARPVTRFTCIVVVEVEAEEGRREMGLLADRVSQVTELSAGEVEAPPAFGTRVRADYLEGLGRQAQGFVLLLDVDRVLSAPELLAGAAAAEAPLVAPTAAPAVQAP
jgi:purine-binding chemotaxis protein CheW